MYLDENLKPVKIPYPSPRPLSQRLANPLKVTFTDLVVGQIKKEFLSSFKNTSIENSLAKV